MSERQYKFVRASRSVSIPVPLGLTPEQETEYVARFLGQTSPEELEAEAREWEQIVRDFEEGRTIPAHQVLRELERMAQDESSPGGDPR